MAFDLPKVTDVEIEIDDRKSMGSVRSNVKLEKDPVMKALAEGCDAEIRARVTAAEEAAKTGAENSDK
ncbi:hypothetical protein Mal52_21830 [Symmachiella dynata]|uniref:Uncharacterized protein n=1 Tax=Symmachiella dynata TaxID=2527995 RepID=A0A517ZMM8_9PLAN|nr:hypothetical protein [Symmachiella dynata]QDU43707.1 hypothetical protein Mal52_21830 [Symmachiella dynata]